jgi:hypothetical protein
MLWPCTLQFSNMEYFIQKLIKSFILFQESLEMEVFAYLKVKCDIYNCGVL